MPCNRLRLDIPSAPLGSPLYKGKVRDAEPANIQPRRSNGNMDYSGKSRRAPWRALYVKIIAKAVRKR